MLNLDTNDLSDRERDILKLVATGVSNKEIAHKLLISSNTVKVHLRNIFTKIGAASRTEAAMYAVKIGLVETASPLTKSNDAELPLPDNQPAPLVDLAQPTDSLLKHKTSIRRSWIYFAIAGGIIIAIILTLVLLNNNSTPSTSTKSPTTTPRQQWFELPGLPTPRQGLAVVNYNNQIYAIGGEANDGISNVVERFNPMANSWTALSPKPTRVTDISAATIGGLIYVPGGRVSSESPTEVTEIYDPQNNTWSTGKSLPKALSAYALAEFEGQIYLFGGWDGSQVVNDAYVYDYHNDTWSSIPPMPTARSYAGAVVVDGNIYVIGGWNGHEAMTTVEIYRPDISDKTGQWSQAPSLPFGQYGMGVANLSNIIFVIGGVNSDQNLTTIALIPEETDWVKIDSPLQTGWSFLGSTSIGTRFYALGGKTKAGFSNQTWSYQAIYTISLPIVR
jgi:DNA-binding CsgD family transcriptional regulator